MRPIFGGARGRADLSEGVRTLPVASVLSSRAGFGLIVLMRRENRGPVPVRAERSEPPAPELAQLEHDSRAIHPADAARCVFRSCSWWAS